MKKKTPNLPTDDKSLWHQAMSGVRAYGQKKTQDCRKAPKIKTAIAVRDRQAAPPALKAPRHSLDLDDATARKLKRRSLILDARLDLHGMTQTEAHKALSAFVARCYRSDKRSLLVITGKGLKSGGTLRRLLPLWLEEENLRPYIVGLKTAAPADGGDGAFYVRLRKKG